MRFDLLTLLVSNIQESLDFYRDIVGFQVEKSRDDYIELHHVGVRLALYPRGRLAEFLGRPEWSEQATGPAINLSLPVSDDAAVDELFKKMKQRGAAVVYAPALLPWGQRAAFFQDPDGNLIEIYASPSSKYKV